MKENIAARSAAAGVALLTAAVVAVSAALAWRFIRASAPTYDEPVHIASGYVALTTTRLPMNDQDHGPMIEAWNALPLLLLRPALVWGELSWNRLFHYGNAFLYGNRVDADRMVFWTRLWSLLSWTAILAPALILWSLRLAGWPAAVASAALLAFCPLWLSSAGLVTTDAGSTALFFLTFWILSAPARPIKRWLAAGAVAGLAMAGKYNMAVIAPLSAAAWLTDLRLAHRKGDWRGPAVMAAACFAAVFALYLGRIGFFLKALTDSMGNLANGRSSFLWGRYSTKGWLWYFPFALAVKTPIATLLAWLSGLALVGRLIPKRERIWLLLPPAFYFAAACRSHTQIGVRHLLPIFPFLMTLGACAAAWAWRAGQAGRACALALGAWLIVSVTRASPDFLAYFNEAAGGPRNGWTLLADSNVDWGQGLKELGAELRRRGDPPVYLSYFGVADPQYYGIRYVPVGIVSNVDLTGPSGTPPPPRPEDPVLFAISATNLQGVYYQNHAIFAWLKSRAPVFTAGHSLFLYDLTSDVDGRKELAGVLAMIGATPWAKAVASKN